MPLARRRDRREHIRMHAGVVVRGEPAPEGGRGRRAQRGSSSSLRARPSRSVKGVPSPQDVPGRRRPGARGDLPAVRAVARLAVRADRRSRGHHRLPVVFAVAVRCGGWRRARRSRSPGLRRSCRCWRAAAGTRRHRRLRDPVRERGVRHAPGVLPQPRLGRGRRRGHHGLRLLRAARPPRSTGGSPQLPLILLVLAAALFRAPLAWTAGALVRSVNRTRETRIAQAAPSSRRRPSSSASGSPATCTMSWRTRSRS